MATLTGLSYNTEESHRASHMEKPNQLQIVDCNSDDNVSDNDAEKAVEVRELNSCKGILDVPVGSAPAPNFGHVAVTHSENVHFGNKTYFNGPVTIKQFIQNKGTANRAYVKTDDENITPNQPQQSELSVPLNNVSQKKITFRFWHKIFLSVFCVTLTGAGAALIVNFTGKSSQHSPDVAEQGQPITSVYNSTSRSDDVVCFMFLVVVAWCINNYNLLLFVTLGIVSSLLSLLIMEKVCDKQKESPPPKEEFRRCVPLIIAPNHLRIVSRSEWLAQPVEKPLDRIKHPVPWVIIAHTATEACESQSECVLHVRLIQNYHVESRGWYDIGYNYLVGGDGSAYYARGWDDVGAHTKGYNNISMGIAFIGTFTNIAPPQQQLDACKKLIQLGVDLGKISKDYKLLAHRQLMSTRSPGDKLYEILKTWPHFVHDNTSIADILPHRA